VRRAAPIAFRSGGRVRLLDPTWPAEVALDASDLAALRRVRTERTIGEHPRGGRPSSEDIGIETIQRLVELGLLVTVTPAARSPAE
jgi:hypothetical protein